MSSSQGLACGSVLLLFEYCELRMELALQAPLACAFSYPLTHPRPLSGSLLILSRLSHYFHFKRINEFRLLLTPFGAAFQ